MHGEFLKGDIKDVCAELKREAERCKGITVFEWLWERAHRRYVAQLIAENKDRREMHEGVSN